MSNVQNENLNGQVPNNPDNDEISTGFFNIKGRWAIKFFSKLLALVLIIATLVYAFAGEKVGEIYARFKNPEVFEQFDRLNSHIKIVAEVIQAWNHIESIDATQTAKVQFIRDKVKGALAISENLKVDKLSNANQAMWHLNTAKLNNIMYDLTSEKEYYKNSMKHIENAKKVTDERGSLDKEDIKGLNEQNFFHHLDWTEIALRSLHVYEGNLDSREVLISLRDRMGGCEFFIRESLAHLKMKEALECNF